MGSRVKEEERNEKIIRGLLKLPGNRRCINCNSLGPQYVCTNFSTFICTNCSGIHREFTHSVKSISVAKFTSQEVSALQEGGNEHAKEIYFKHWDFQGQSVVDSSDVDKLRTFIKNVYVERRYIDQRIGDHLPQAKIQGNRESFGHSNADSSQGVSKSTYVGTYEDNHGPKRGIESLSENKNNSNGHPVGGLVDQSNSSTMGREKASFRSHLRPDDLSKTGGKSEHNQKDAIASASSVVQAPKDTNSKKAVLPIRLLDPPRSQKATTSYDSTEAKMSISSRTNDPNPGTVQDSKLYMSKNLIDLDSDVEPPQRAVQTEMQKKSLPRTDVGWATFNVATPKKTTTMPSTSSTNSLEGSMLQISDSASIPQSRFPTAQTAKSLSFSPANHGSQQHQHYFSLVNAIQSNNPPLNTATSAPVNSQLWRAASHAPTVQGSVTLAANRGSNILIGTHPAIVSASQKPAPEVTSNGRKALPEDIFTISYRAVSSAWNWQTNPHVNMEYGQYGTHYPVGVVNITQHAHPYPIHSVNLARRPSSAHASPRFPSLTSMQEVLPSMGCTALSSHASGMGSVGSVLSSHQVPFPSAAHNQYMVQHHAVKVQYNTLPTGRYEGKGFATTATAYGLSPMDQRLAAQSLQAIAQSSLPRVGGNPFA